MLAPNNSGSWSNHTLIYVGDFGATVSQRLCLFSRSPSFKQACKSDQAYQPSPLRHCFSHLFCCFIPSFLCSFQPQEPLSPHFVRILCIVLCTCMRAFADLNACVCEHSSTSTRPALKLLTTVNKHRQKLTNNLFVRDNHCYLIHLRCQPPINQ